jgi:hypothetical protein
MQDSEFMILQVKAAVCPAKDSWPSPDVQISILGDRPTIKGELFWSALHDCVTDARTRVLKTFGSMAAIDEDRNLSPTGKIEKKREIATKAIAEFAKSKSLEKARASVEHQVAKWDEQLAPKAGDVAINAEIRAHLAALKPGDRMAFIEAHIADVAAAVLTAPSFLSGLTPAELGVVKQRIAARANPEVAAAKQATTKALSETEAGWRAAIRQISDRGGLGKAPNDGVAQRAGTSV